MREYDVYYRARGDRNGQEFNCTITCNSKDEAKSNFEQYDNRSNEWTVVRVEKR